MSEYRIVEAHNHLAVHCLTWCEGRAIFWIEKGTGARFYPGTLFQVQHKNHGTGDYYDVGTPRAGGGVSAI